jgi:probable H4MPT-linked C1 transfer pathway protein
MSADERSKRPQILGLDIGGANLKAAHSDGSARTFPFALWKQPQQLADELRQLVASMPHADSLAVTMTGELCDCYESKRQGVNAILDSVEQVASGFVVKVWRNDGVFVDLETARQTPLQVAAANWLALATFAGQFAPHGTSVLIDVGSTTTDIIPLQNGKPIPKGRTDPERLLSGELVYTGVRRTPLCTLLRYERAAEWFATTLDVCLILDLIAENADDCDTADGRPATKGCAHARIARMMCADLETSTADERRLLATEAFQRQIGLIAQKLTFVMERMSEAPRTIVTSGSGSFIIPVILDCQSLLASVPRRKGPREKNIPRSRGVTQIALRDKIGAAAADAGCAYAVAVLAQEQANAIR